MITRFILSTIAGIVNLLLLCALGAGLFVYVFVAQVTKDLPSYEQLRQYNPPTISRTYDAKGGIIDEFATERRIFASYDEIPPLLIEAIISAEDKNFFTHSGFDPLAIAVAVRDAVESRGESVRGASTITQQVMKNFLLTADRTVDRKVREIVLAQRFEQAFSKEEILELYLNEIFLGQNAYGVAAAALTYFNKPLQDLTLVEAAYIAGLPKSPSGLHPVRNYDGAVERRNYVLSQMKENGYIDQATLEQAITEPLRTVQSGHIPAYQETIPPRDYVTEEVRRQVLAMFGEELVAQGGLHIEASFDPELQDAARKVLRDGLIRLDRAAGVWRPLGLNVMPNDPLSERAWFEALRKQETLVRDMPGWRPAGVVRVVQEGAYVAVEEQGGIRLGLVLPDQARDWGIVERDGEGVRNRSLSDMLLPGEVIYVEATGASEGEYPVYALRQVPKVEGAFLAVDVETGRVLAMQGGFSFDRSNFNRTTQALRQTGSSFKPFLYAAALERGYTAASLFDDVVKTITVGNESWTPQNASGRTYGRTTMRVGMERSLNLLTLDIGQAIGLEAIGEMSERLGVYDTFRLFPANMLGSQETTLWNMVRAYAAFASGGERVDISAIARIRARNGDVLYEHGPVRCEDCEEGTIRLPRPQIMSPVTAYQMTDMLKGVITNGTATRVQLPVPVAGKTGTTNDARDVWFVGYTPRIVAGCFIGYDDPAPLGRGAGGGTVCAPVFDEFMKVAVEKYPSEDFVVPDEGYYAYFSSGREVPYATETREFVPGEGVSQPEGSEWTTDPELGQDLPETSDEVLPDSRGSVGTGGLY